VIQVPPHVKTPFAGLAAQLWATIAWPLWGVAIKIEEHRAFDNLPMQHPPEQLPPTITFVPWANAFSPDELDRIERYGDACR
jgi:hypothetical protein